jgi:hypothetical protein
MNKSIANDSAFVKKFFINDVVLGVFIILLTTTELITYAALIDGQNTAIRLIELLRNKSDTHLLNQYRFIHGVIQGCDAYDMLLMFSCLFCFRNDKWLLAWLLFILLMLSVSCKIYLSL